MEHSVHVTNVPWSFLTFRYLHRRSGACLLQVRHPVHAAMKVVSGRQKHMHLYLIRSCSYAHLDIYSVTNIYFTHIIGICLCTSALFRFEWNALASCSSSLGLLYVDFGT